MAKDNLGVAKYQKHQRSRYKKWVSIVDGRRYEADTEKELRKFVYAARNLQERNPVDRNRH